MEIEKHRKEQLERSDVITIFFQNLCQCKGFDLILQFKSAASGILNEPGPETLRHDFPSHWQ